MLKIIYQTCSPIHGTFVGGIVSEVIVVNGEFGLEQSIFIFPGKVYILKELNIVGYTGPSTNPPKPDRL